jgi:hypothetical protein
MKANEGKKNKFLCRHGKKWLVQLANLSRQKAQKAQNRNAFYALQYAMIAPFREDFTTDGTDFTDWANAECRM